MTQTLLHQILDYANRADPYPIYEELRRTPVHHEADGPFVISTYYEIRSLLHDPRISSDARNLASNSADPLAES
ncbi:cytochrome P450, partial [Streptomyces tanashiensis]